MVILKRCLQFQRKNLLFRKNGEKTKSHFFSDQTYLTLLGTCMQNQKLPQGCQKRFTTFGLHSKSLLFFPSRIFFWMLLCCCISLTKFSHKSHTVSEVKTIRPLNFQARLLYFLEIQNNDFSSAKKKQPTK